MVIYKNLFPKLQETCSNLAFNTIATSILAYHPPDQSSSLADQTQ